MLALIDDAEILARGPANGLARPLRAALAGLPEEAVDALVERLVFELPEVEAPPVQETTRGAHRRLDGSGYRVFRKEDDSAIQAVKTAFAGFKAAYLDLTLPGLSAVAALGRMLFLMHRNAVEVDVITGAALARLEGQGAGLTATEVAGGLPPAWGVTADDVTEALTALLGRSFKDGKPLALLTDDRWRAPHL